MLPSTGNFLKYFTRFGLMSRMVPGHEVLVLSQTELTDQIIF